MILWGRLNIPYITSVTSKLSALDCSSYGIRITDRTTSGIDKPSSLLEVLEEIGIDKTLGAFMQGAIYSNDVAL